jgi:hypothetical protein
VSVEIGEPDLLIHFPQRSYAVECKRPLHWGSIRKNVEEASRQLRDKLKSGEYGMIAISLDRALNPKHLLAAVSVKSGSNVLGEAHSQMLAFLHRKCIDIMREIAAIKFDSKIVALHLDLNGPVLTDSGEFLQVHVTQMYPTSEPSAIRNRKPSESMTPEFSYLNDSLDETLRAHFEPSAWSVIEQSNAGMKSGRRPGVLRMYIKDPSALGGLRPITNEDLG